MVKDDGDDARERGRKFWSARAGRELTTEDAREIEHNLTGFFAAMLRWEATNDDVETAEGEA